MTKIKISEKAIKYYPRIKKLRLEADYSPAEVADHIGLTPTAYIRLEEGEKSPSIAQTVLLAQFYNTSLDYLAGLTQERSFCPGTAMRCAGSGG